MEKRPYPTRDGLPVPVEELGLEPSRFNLVHIQNYSNHHYLYGPDFDESDFILSNLRNLEALQILLPKDQHNLGRKALHHLYSPPELPSYKVAMDVLEGCHMTGGRFKLYDTKAERYVYVPFSNTRWKKLQKAYNLKNE